MISHNAYSVVTKVLAVLEKNLEAKLSVEKVSIKRYKLIM
jgi:hypothetical protein